VEKSIRPQSNTIAEQNGTLPPQWCSNAFISETADRAVAHVIRAARKAVGERINQAREKRHGSPRANVFNSRWYRKIPPLPSCCCFQSYSTHESDGGSGEK
jgi:hypothetical protein